VNTLDEAITLVNNNPFGNGTGIFTQSGARRPQISERDRRGSSGHQRADSGAGADLQFYRIARLQARRSRTLRQTGGAVLHPDKNRDDALVRRHRPVHRRDTTISLK